jgi:hypothetical protein
MNYQQAELNVKKLDKLMQAVFKVNSAAYNTAQNTIENKNSRTSPSKELGYQANMIEKVAPVQVKTISPEQVYSAAVAQPFQGQILSEFSQN